MPAQPHGGKFTQTPEVPSDSDRLKGFGPDRTVKLTPESVKTVWNLASGIFSPLEGFMTEQQYDSVLDQMRLDTDHPWTLPVILASDSSAGTEGDVLLTDQENHPVAVMSVESSFRINKKEYANKVFGTEDGAHPGVAKVYQSPDRAIGGRLSLVARPDYGPFANVTLSPKETRVLFNEKGWDDVIAFQTRNAPHIGHEYVQKMSLLQADGLFINPVLGKKKPGDFADEVIVATYKALLKDYYPRNSVVMSVLHYEMQYAGPREAIMHAIMRKNFGCTKIAIGRDHAGVGDYYGPYAAQEIFKEFPDLGIEMVPMKEFYYCKKCEGIANESICPHGDADRLTFSGTKLRQMFQSGQAPPKQYMRPEVAKVILESKRPFVE